MKPSAAIVLLNKVALCAVMLPIAGCAVPLPTIEVVAPQFRLLGKAVIRQPEKTERFNLIWERENLAKGLTDTIWVQDRLGGTKAQLEISPNKAHLTVAKKTWSADSAETLSRRAFGFSLPVRAIGFWLTGNADPAYPVRRETDFIEQLGWEVRYESYFDDGMPKRINLRFKKGQQALLVIQKWQ